MPRQGSTIALQLVSALGRAIVAAPPHRQSGAFHAGPGAQPTTRCGSCTMADKHRRLLLTQAGSHGSRRFPIYSGVRRISSTSGPCWPSPLLTRRRPRTGSPWKFSTKPSASQALSSLTSLNCPSWSDSAGHGGRRMKTRKMHRARVTEVCALLVFRCARANQELVELRS